MNNAECEVLRKALEQSLDAMIFATGSSDFAVGGQARLGFERKLKPAIDNAMEVLGYKEQTQQS